MSSIFNITAPPKVFVDTTVLCGAIRVDGVNRKILRAANYPLIYRPVISRTCLLEFVRNAIVGIGNVQYTIDEIYEFLTFFIEPIYSHYEDLPTNSPVGRYAEETRRRENQPIGHVLVELSHLTEKQILEIAMTEDMTQPLHEFDQEDFHVWSTALEQQCDYILTTNKHKFPEVIGNMRRVHPSDFYEEMVRYLESGPHTKTLVKLIK